VRKFINILLVLSLSIFCHTLFAQICGGNLGENIFTDGDFGSGTAVVQLTDPMIAPGYQYTTDTPPGDGYYTLTRNIGDWPWVYGTWLEIGDNSGSSSGYTMVVNASFQPGLFYEQLVEGLCENTLYVFTADVINLIKPSVADHIKPNVSFLIDDVAFYTTGAIAQDAQWNTYGFTFITAPGQTSVELSLRNNAPGGIGNDLALDNIEFRACGPEALILPLEVENICEEGSPIDLDATVVGSQYDTPAFQWQQSFDEGATWQDIPGATSAIYTHTDLSSGYYYYRYLLANGPSNLGNFKCRVVSNVKIVYVVPKFHNIIDTLCNGLSYIVEDHAYTQSGVYVDSLLSSLGCDSIVTLDLTFVPDSGVNFEVIHEDPDCYNGTDGSILIDKIFNGAPPYAISFADQPAGSNASFEFLQAGDYPIKIEDRHGCFDEQLITIQNPPEFFVDLGNDLFINLGDLVQINPATNYPIDHFSWLPEAYGCTADCWDLEWYPYSSADLTLTAVSEAGCLTSDSIHISVIKNRDVYIPNVFTPNDDGVNDSFSIFGTVPNIQKINHLTVFNRWGAVVFEQKDFLPNQESNGWNGKFRGEKAPKGVYTYFTEILFLDGETKQFSGDVLLMK
jgi:gliding motility-associated-like protein